jgi:DNA-binding transcriptional MerR regulator
MPQTMSMQDCARILNIQSYRIQYAYAHNRLPEPPRVGGRRIFTPEMLQQLAAHFGVALPTAETAAQPVGA